MFGFMFFRSVIGHHGKVQAIAESAIVMRIPVLLVLCAVLTPAQVPSIANQLSPAFRSELNVSLQDAASVTGSYSNPAWITALAYAKITGVPSFEAPLTFSAPLVRSANAISCPTCGTGGSGAWGSITGTLSSQTDLNAALNLKAPLASPVFTGNATISGTMTAASYLAPPGT